ncbi:MAG: ABC transporter ATP-binding protein, partial [Leptolyngbyaceae bacterium]|nr:ABC transporter ATP-binding protein [Leptolyngbyaceae bacterium]
MSQICCPMPMPLKQYGSLLTKYLQPQQGRVIGLAIALLSSTGLQLLNPQILRYFIDTAFTGGSQSALVLAALMFIGVALLTQLLAIAATYLGENVAWTATNALRADLVEHCLELDLSFHKSRTPGELIERIDGDVNLLSRFFSQFTIQVLGSGLLLMGVLVVLFYEDWRAGLGLSVYAVVALGTLLRLRLLAISGWTVYRQIGAEFFGFLGEYLAGREDIRANGAVSYVMHHFHQLLQRWLPAYHRARLASTVLWTTSVGLFTTGTIVALAIGLYLWNQQAITIGTVYLIFYYTELLSDPIERIRVQLEDLQQAEAGINRIQELLQTQSQLSDGGMTSLPDLALSVSFRQVCFSYEMDYQTDAEPEWALENLSFYLPAGQVLGVLGRTGSGKTTLSKLLLRLYAAQQGEICLGGVAIDQTPLREIPQRVGLVTQDVQIFQTTIRNNLTFFNPRIPDSQLQKTLATVGLGSWLETLPAGLETLLGTDGIGLSAGQAQLLAFARVFLKNPGLVILDEASSRLDPQTEALIEQAIAQLFTNCTGIIIAHRLQTVQRADQILILEQGRVLEYG